MPKKIIFLGFSSTFLATLVFWLAFGSFVLGPDYFINESFPSKYVIPSSELINNESNYYKEVGLLVSKGIIVDIKEVWEFQGSYYSTLISVLIAVIGIMGVLTFMYIKNASLEVIRESAESAAKDATKSITDSFDFVDKFNSRIDDGIADIGEQLESKTSKEELKRELEKLTNRIHLIEKIIASSDSTEEEGMELELSLEEEHG